MGIAGPSSSPGQLRGQSGAPRALRKVKPVTTAATGPAWGWGEPTRMRIPRLPQATCSEYPQHPLGDCSSTWNSKAQGCRAALPTPGPCQSYLCLRRAGGVRGNPRSGLRQGRMLGDTLLWFPKGKARKSSVGSLLLPSRGSQPATPPSPPRVHCYFWQPPKSSSQAINNESAKFVWPLLYKER